MSSERAIVECVQCRRGGRILPIKPLVGDGGQAGHNLGKFLRGLAAPRPVKHWPLTTLREKLIKIGAKAVHHARYVTFQMAEVAVPRQLLRAILGRIRRLRLLPVPARGG